MQVPDQDAPDMERNHDYNFDLAVLGGGSGGLACAKEAAKHGAKVINDQSKSTRFFCMHIISFKFKFHVKTL